MVAVRVFSGLVSSIWALASAVAIAPMVSLDWCMACLRAEKVETHRSGLRPLGPNSVSDGFLGILRHQPFELGLGRFMLEVGRPGSPERGGKLRPSVGRAHVDAAHRLDPRP